MSLFVLWLGACADVTSPEDGAALGPVVSLKDFFTSCFLMDGVDVVLFDACWRKGRLERALKAQGLEPDDVRVAAAGAALAVGAADPIGSSTMMPMFLAPLERARSRNLIVDS